MTWADATPVDRLMSGPAYPAATGQEVVQLVPPLPPVAVDGGSAFTRHVDTLLPAVEHVQCRRAATSDFHTIRVR